MNGARSPLLGALLSFLLPGLGQVYAGRPRRALLFLVPALVAWAAVLWAVAQGRTALLGYLFDAPLLNALLVLNILLLALHLVAVGDAYRLISARRVARGAVPARSATAGGLSAGLLLLLAATVVAHGIPEWYGYQVATRLPAFTAAGSPGVPTPSWELSPTPSAQPTPSGQPTPTDGGPTASPSASVAPSPTGSAPPGAAWADDGRLNVLLIGSDAGPGRWSARPDAIHLLSVDVASGRAALFAWSRYTSNFPVPPETAHMFRDGRYPGYINELYVAAINNPRRFPYNDEAGWGVLAGAVQELAGVKVDGYAMVDLLGFMELVDALDGLWIDVPAPVVDSHYGDGFGRQTSMRLDAGCQELNGKRALFFSRTRHQDGDIARLHRQQVTLTSLHRTYDPLALVARLPELLDVAGEHAHISFAPSDWPALAELAVRVDPARIGKVVFEYPEPYPRNLKDDTLERIQAKVRGIFDEPAPAPSGGDCPAGAP